MSKDARNCSEWGSMWHKETGESDRKLIPWTTGKSCSNPLMGQSVGGMRLRLHLKENLRFWTDEYKIGNNFDLFG